MFARASKVVAAVAICLAVGGLAVNAFTPPVAASALTEKHPKIRKALDDLRDARDELEKADTDFGGHKKAAIEAVKVAIDQLKICIDND
jgi:hypothetical protein